MRQIRITRDDAYRAMCLIILAVLVASSITPGDVTPGRSTSIRNRVQRKIDDIVDGFTDMLDGPQTNPERAPPVFDEREDDGNTRNAD